jgi:hypothetical protein
MDERTPFAPYINRPVATQGTPERIGEHHCGSFAGALLRHRTGNGYLANVIDEQLHGGADYERSKS